MNIEKVVEAIEIFVSASIEADNRRFDGYRDDEFAALDRKEKALEDLRDALSEA